MTQWLLEEAAFVALDRAEHAAVEKAEQGTAATSTRAHLVEAATRMVQQARL